MPLINSNKNLPIGLFDSGLGGLTVLKELISKLPNENFIYFADTANLPYGNRSKAELTRFAYNIISWMKRKNVKMIIMACNTSSALVFDEVTKYFSTPIINLITPTAEAVAALGKKRIGIIATYATVKSGAYHNAINKANNTLKTYSVACNLLAPLIEEIYLRETLKSQIVSPTEKKVNLKADEMKLIKNYLNILIKNNIEALVYGCTHYPLLADVIEKVLYNCSTFIDPAYYLSIKVIDELNNLELANDQQQNPKGQVEFYVTGEPDNFTKSAYLWLGYMPKVEKVVL